MPSLSSAARRARAAADNPNIGIAPAAQEPTAGASFANAAPSGSPAARGRESTGRDIPFEVRGFATDPKHSGYQILTNYESTYWAPIVGNESWRLYEVLRSFCHQGNNTCHPSINL